MTDWEDVYPVFSWEEDYIAPTMSPAVDELPITCLHSATCIDGHEGLMPDTGAVGDLSGSTFIQRQDLEASKHGYRVEWQDLPRPQGVSGVGGRDAVCTKRAIVPGKLVNGALIKSCPAVIPDSTVPPLRGLDTMACLNVYFGTKFGKFIMVPEGKDEEIVWPEGAEIIDMVKAPSGHWLLTVSAWTQARRSGPSGSSRVSA